MALPKSALKSMERKAMQMHWELYRKGDARYTEDQSVVAIGVGDNKRDVERAFALAGTLRLTSLFGHQMAWGSDIICGATHFICEAIRDAKLELESLVC